MGIMGIYLLTKKAKSYILILGKLMLYNSPGGVNFENSNTFQATHESF